MSQIRDEFARQVEALQPQLMRFAHLQLSNNAWAEDAVSDTVVAALERPRSFEGRSQLKTWLIGILKHKVVDQIRRYKRDMTFPDVDDSADVDGMEFSSNVHWRELPSDRGAPEDSLRERQFMEALESCIEGLPTTQARAFTMCELLELSTEEVCLELGVTRSNLWVQLHRARMRLRDGMRLKWSVPPS
jgi:RNA polymerase sigma-70 factor (TIGR02943 family)